MLRERVAPREAFVALRPWACKGLLPSVAPYVRDQGEARSLREPAPRARRPFAGVVALVHADVLVVDVRDERGEVREDDAAVIPEAGHRVGLGVLCAFVSGGTCWELWISERGQQGACGGAGSLGVGSSSSSAADEEGEEEKAGDAERGDREGLPETLRAIMEGTRTIDACAATLHLRFSSSMTTTATG